MTVIIQDQQNVFIDGANAGALVDALRNHPDAAMDISEALAVWKSGAQDAQSSHGSQVLLSGLKSLCKEFSEALAEAGKLAKVTVTLRLADSITLADFTGTLTGRTPADVQTLLGFVAAVDALANGRAFEGGPTYRESILAFAVAAEATDGTARGNASR